MGKPDRQLTLTECLRYFANGELSEREAEEQLKALMLKLVGAYSDYAVAEPVGDYNQGVADVLIEIKEKIAAL
jgi:hypothetical protein